MIKAYQLLQPGDENTQQFTHQKVDEVRINKYLAASGFCSRREGDKLVADGRVTIEGTLAQTGSKVIKGQTVMVDRKIVEQKGKKVYIALNKPVGITSTTESNIEGNLVNFMDYPERIFPIGRLDKDSSGLILLTSDGDIVNKILRAENSHEKEYIVTVNKPITGDFIEHMANGVEITNMRNKTRVITNKSKIKQLTNNSFSLILTQGLNRQIRRMCTELGYSVEGLERVRIMNITLAPLKTGQWRYLTQKELDIINKDV